MNGTQVGNSLMFFTSSTVLAVLLLLLCLSVYVWFRIFKKAGYNSAYGFLMLVPFVNVVMIFILAFNEWPIEKQLKLLKSDFRPLPPVEGSSNIGMKKQVAPVAPMK